MDGTDIPQVSPQGELDVTVTLLSRLHLVRSGRRVGQLTWDECSRWNAVRFGKLRLRSTPAKTS